MTDSLGYSYGVNRKMSSTPYGDAQFTTNNSTTRLQFVKKGTTLHLDLSHTFIQASQALPTVSRSERKSMQWFFQMYFLQLQS